MKVDCKTLEERWCHILGVERVSAIVEVLVDKKYSLENAVLC